MTFDFTPGAARRLTALDVAKAAYDVGCTEDQIRAVLEVETRGGGFDRHNRPRMLFEPHVFYRECAPGAEREKAVARGLAYRKWGEQPYPSDSYPRLLAAMQINPTAALRSASWGIGQIMGFNHRLAGYATVEEMVTDFKESESRQLQAMLNFIVAMGLDDDLRRCDWRGFARGYNGAGYEAHGYHIKLKAAYDKWRRQPDTPFTPEHIDRGEPAPNPPRPIRYGTRQELLRRGAEGLDVRILQSCLNRLGYPVGPEDGKFGRLTHDAVVAFQSDAGLVADGVVGELTWEALSRAEPREAREPITVAGLRERGSKTIKEADRGQIAVAGAGGFAALQAISDTFLNTAERLEGLSIGQRLTAWASDHVDLVVVVLCAAVAAYSLSRVKARRVRDHNRAVHRGR